MGAGSEMGSRYFSSQAAPVQFNVQPSSPVHVPPHDTSFDVKRQLAAKAYDKASVDNTKPVEASEDSQGSTVNVPDGTKTTDPQRYYDNLRAVGLGDFAVEQETKMQDIRKKNLELQQQQITLTNQQTDFAINHLNKSLQLAASGDYSLAVQIANQVKSPGTRVTSITPMDKAHENFMIKSEDNPDGKVLNRAATARAMASAKEQMDDFFPVKYDSKTGVGTQTHALTGETKHVFTVSAEVLKDGKPKELGTDEVALPDGRAAKVGTILDAYKSTYQHLFQYTDDPKAMLLLESTNPEKAASVKAKAAAIPSPVEWAKGTFSVDITGKTPSNNTRPSSEVGGRAGAITPTGKGWMDSMPNASEHKGYQIEDNKGKKLISDGNDWLSREEFDKKYPKRNKK